MSETLSAAQKLYATFPERHAIARRRLGRANARIMVDGVIA